MVSLSSLRWQPFRLASLALSMALALACLTSLPTPALVLMDTYTINHAIRYGAIKQNSGYQGLLGPNWVLGKDGALLNVYTPYMVLAGKAMRLGLPKELDEATLKEAREKLGKELRYLNDAKEPKSTKMMLSLLGNEAAFHQGIEAKLVGKGRGRVYTLKPTKALVPKVASPLKLGGSAQASHEVVVSFYFKLADQLKLEGDYALVVTLPTAPDDPWVFKLNNDVLH